MATVVLFLPESAVWVCIFTTATFHSSIIPMVIRRSTCVSVLYLHVRPPTCCWVLYFRLHRKLYRPSKESTYGFFLLSSPDFDAARECQYSADSIWLAALSQQGFILHKAAHLKGFIRCYRVLNGAIHLSVYVVVVVVVANSLWQFGGRRMCNQEKV